jgi:hypothetical protein
MKVDKKMALKSINEKLSGNVLDEVVIKGKKIIKDSKNLNGPGEADFTITKEELEKAGQTTLGDLLEKRIKGFRLKLMKGGGSLYVINDRMVHLIIDGMDTEFFWGGQPSLDIYFKQFFDYYDAEEISGIEVMTFRAARYNQRFLHPLAAPFGHAFIEVTTRGGVGPFLKKTVGTYLYKPMPFTMPRNFYSPKYIAQSVPDKTDIRSTIFWKPDLITNKEGIASLSFYTADTPGKYSVIIEGTDLNGKLGYKRGQILVR